MNTFEPLVATLTLPDTSSYALLCLSPRPVGLEKGFSKDDLNNLMNARWLELQDRLLEKQMCAARNLKMM